MQRGWPRPFDLAVADGRLLVAPEVAGVGQALLLGRLRGAVPLGNLRGLDLRQGRHDGDDDLAHRPLEVDALPAEEVQDHDPHAGIVEVVDGAADVAGG